MRIPLIVAGLIALILPGAGISAPDIASITKMTGLVRVAHAPSVSDWQDARPGMPLQEKDRIKTLDGSRDRAEIRFKDGSVIRLAPRTTFEITTYEVDSRGRVKRIASRLFGGMLRAVVNKIEPDQKFEIYSNHAVASVKGTDFIFDGSTVTVIDEKDGIRHSVVISDPTGGKILEVLAGMMGGLREDGTPINPTAVDPAVINAILSGLDGGGSGRSGSGSGAGDGDGSGGGDGEGGGNENTIDPESLRDDLTDFADSNDLSDIADNQERFTDVITGSVLVDMNGYRVRTEQYVARPKPATIEYIALNSREGGPNAGLTIMDKKLNFNTALPENFEDVRKGLPAAMNNPAKMPDYFLASDSFIVKNPAGDTLYKENIYGLPQPVMDSHTINIGSGSVLDAFGQPTVYGYDSVNFTWNYDETGATQVAWGQQVDKKLFLGTSAGAFIPKEHFMVDRYGRVERRWYAGCSPTPSETTSWYNLTMMFGSSDLLWAEMYPVSLDSSINTGLYSDASIDNLIPKLGNSNFGTGYTSEYFDDQNGIVKETIYGDSTWLRSHQYLVNKEGVVVDAYSRDMVSTGIEDLNDWTGADLYMEMVYTAAEWVDPITDQPSNIDIIFGPISDFASLDSPPDIEPPDEPPPPQAP